MINFGKDTVIRFVGGQVIFRVTGLEEMRIELANYIKRSSNLSRPFQVFQKYWFDAISEVFDDHGDPPRSWPELSPAYCVEAGSLILTKDLRWVRAGDLTTGDELWAPSDIGTPDSAGRAMWRYWEPSEVIATQIETEPTLRLIFESGRSIVATPSHPWLVRGRSSSWREPLTVCPECGFESPRPSGLGIHRRRRHDVPGVGWNGRAHVDTVIAWKTMAEIRQGDRLPMYAKPWTTLNTYDAGWFAGLLDGEAHLRVAEGRGGITGRGAVTTIGIAQKEGFVAERAREVMAAADMQWHEDVAKESGVIRFSINGGSSSTARILGMYRPVRLLPKWRGGILRAIGEEVVVRSETAGYQPVAKLMTTTGTFFSDGLAAHNSVWKQRYWSGQPIMRRSDALYDSLTNMTSSTIWHVGPRSLEFGTRVPHFIYHQEGLGNNPQRPVLVLPDSAADRLQLLIEDYILTGQAR